MPGKCPYTKRSVGNFLQILTKCPLVSHWSLFQILIKNADQRERLSWHTNPGNLNNSDE